ncbi:STAS domain-containing protein [Chitinophaga sp. SYP-B3965]|uniref:STAS domain-containing protein n=1 Tax=Chitinophaga sp. SYP-B3965 TaxID=2663120 RepID=UPI001299AB67|nr:STAS domain-containing protein [Chitinophaga sp. SYP-B3965]MRG47260.1 STAS domain-containing protein [Chitinophaga sp. SYP-B3965]
MQFKIDTKEKIVLFRLEEPELNANLAAELEETISGMTELEEKNLVLDLRSLQSIDEKGLKAIFAVYNHQYERGLSAAVAHLSPDLAAVLGEKYPEMLNVVPTESEAIDMVMMEDLERELDLGE